MKASILMHSRYHLSSAGINHLDQLACDPSTAGMRPIDR